MEGNLSELMTRALITDHWIVTIRENTELSNGDAHYVDTDMCKLKLLLKTTNTSFTVAVCFEDQGESEKKLQEIKGIVF